jgi:multiple sugar transport system permease protein
MVLAGSKTKTAPLAVNAYMTGFGPEWGPMTASSLLILAPVLLLSLVLRRHMVGGLTAGGVKDA